ncbi:Archaeal DNA helicase HerA or a related bacterial ATPase, containings HAS-barrel and ATPase domains [Nostoc flagelliforme CCNUN1]|uniref:Archaeal DNA helicase HerA or a related bacterial ATPase, containings HAS-barrel and ATPase domains n=2 Tax=Nostoc flagelliforme TaxID=1306274 RepID=A0A2K8SN99_9NOSO|nr:Archaeal DNA helicase HerA or a related bacterial ATPase, containings HAS-barrel and ATPase domains [Nostoc flagelliforme CCNUN1]
MDEMRQRYEDYRLSGLTEEQWTESLRASGKMLSVICEEFTTWTDNIVEPMPDDCEDEKWKPDPDFVGKWFRCAMTESLDILPRIHFVKFGGFQDQTATAVLDRLTSPNLTIDAPTV